MEGKQHIQQAHLQQTNHIRQRVVAAVEGLLYSSLFISCCAFFLTLETYLLAGLPMSLPMALFVFLATLFTYNLSSVQSIIRRPGQAAALPTAPWHQRNKREIAFLGIASVVVAAAVYFLFGLHINSWFLLHLALISVWYTVPITLKGKRLRPLRSVPLLKVFLIAYVWAAVTVFFPLLDAGTGVLEAEAWLLFLRRFLFILALALLFDIRDYTYDLRTRTLTIPGLIGVQNTKLLSLGLLLVYMLLTGSSTGGSVLLALAASAVGAAAVVIFSSEKKPRIYYALLADGAMLLHAGLVYLAYSTT